MKKRLIPLLLALCLAAALLPSAALAAESDWKPSTNYTISAGEATVTAFYDVRFQGDVTVPETLGGCPVTKIGNGAFDSCTGITSIDLPETVREIGKEAFRACSGLASVYLPPAVQAIGEDAFAGCSTDLILYGQLDSFAEQYANANNILFLASGMPFTDVAPGSWYYWNVYSVYTTRLMYGTTETVFSPNAKMSRAMLAAVLYRLAGEPDASGLSCPFTDVSDKRYYYDAVKWCAANGIVYGTTTTTFSPESDVTREQTVAMFSRYCAEIYGCDVRSVYPMNAFSDTGSISRYAMEPFCWAVEHGIISGMGTNPPTLAPKGTTTRAELATMMVEVIQYLNDEDYVVE